MAATIDERIVAAKFDASDFEKGVDKTIKKLDELKKSLDFKEATKSVKELAEKTEVSTNSMSNSLEKLTERFTTFTGMIKQKILSGLADEFANIFLRMEQSVKNFISSINSQQISAGLNKYQDILTSVRIMVGAGESEDAAYDAIERLRDYSDQTSYSLSQMTDALSKLRSSGVGIEDATKAVEGIANACAQAGINATDAQRAFFNLSQAYTKGTLEYTDYRSLELLNMTGRKFRQQMLDAAVEAKTLEKVSEGVYKTVNKTDKKVKANKKVTLDNLNDMLKYDFMNRNAMNILFGKKYFFDEREFKKYKAKNGGDREKAVEEAKKDYGDLAVEAYLAAREARSFLDVLNTIKDYVSTSWSTTFEHLFGKLSQAKDFFTDLAENGIADVIYQINDYRNAILGFWDDTYQGEGGGGAVFRQTILNISDALGTLLNTIFSLLPGFEELSDHYEDKETPTLQKVGDKLFQLTMNIRDFSERLQEAANRFRSFMHEEISEGTGISRLEMLRQVFANLGNVIGIVAKAFSLLLHASSTLFYALHPILDGFIILLKKITDPLANLRQDMDKNGEAFKNITYSIDNLGKLLEPVAIFLGEILALLADVGGWLAQFALDSVLADLSFFTDLLGLITDLLTGDKSAQAEKGVGVLDGLRKSLEGIKDACQNGLGAVKEFFGALLDDIKTLLGLNKEAGASDGKTGGVFAGLTNFFQTNQFIKDAKKWVNDAIINVGDFIKSIPARVKALGANIYDTIYNLLFTKERVKSVDENGKTVFKTVDVLTPLGEWLDGAIKDIKAFILDIPNKIIAGVGKIGNWIDDIFNAIFGDGENKKSDTKNTAKTAEEKAQQEKDARFQEFLDNTIASIKEWFSDLPNKVRKGLKDIGNFFSRLIGVIDEFLFGKKQTQTIKNVDEKGKIIDKKVVTTRVKTGFSKWLDGIIAEVKKFIANIPKYIKEGIKGVGDFVSTIVNAIFGKEDSNKTPTSKDVQEELEKPFLGIDISNIINSLKEIGLEIFNQIARIFTGSDKLEENQALFSTAIANGIRWIRTKAKQAFDWVLEFISTLPKTIAGIFSGENSESPKEGSVGSEIVKFGETIGAFIAGLPASLLTFFNGAITEISKLWQKLYDSISGKSAEGSQYAENEFGHPVSYKHDQVKSSWDSFVEELGKLIASAFENLPKWIAQGIDLAVLGINQLIGGISDWFKNANIEEEAKKATESLTNGTNQLAKGAENAADKVDNEESPLWTAVKNLGLHLFTLITETVPTMISEAWKWIGTKATQIWEGIESLFSGDIPAEKTDTATTKVSGKIQNFIQNELPEKIRGFWNGIKLLAEDIWAGVSSIFTGDIPESERAKAIKKIILGIGNFITKDLPAAISELFSGSKGDKKTKIELPAPDLSPSGKTGLNPKKEAAELTGPIADSFKQGLEDTNEELKETVGDSKTWSFVDDIIPGILDALSGLFDWLSKIATLVIDAITGKNPIDKQVETAYGKESPKLKASLSRIGESLKTFFLETIPKFIGVALGTLLTEAPKWFGKLFEGLSSAAKAEEDKAADGFTGGEDVDSGEAIMTVVGGFFEKIKNAIGSIADNKLLAGIGIIIAITLMLSQLKKIFSIADEIDNIGYTVKWVAITIAMTAIASIAATVGELAKSDDPVKAERAKHFIDSLKDITNAIIEITKWIAWGKIADGVGDVAEAFKKGKDIKLISSDLEGVFGLGSFFKSFASLAGVGAGAYVGGTLLSSAIDTTISTITEAMTNFTSGVEDVVDMIEPFTNRLEGMNSKLSTAIDSVNKIKDLFVGFYNVFDEVYKDLLKAQSEHNNAENIENDAWDTMTLPGLTDGDGSLLLESGTAKQALLDSLSRRIDLFNSVSLFINNLASSLDKIKDIPDIEARFGDLMKPFVSGSFTEFLKALLKSLKDALTEVHLDAKSVGRTPDLYNSEITTIATTMNILADALSVFSSGISGLSEESVNGLDKTLDVFRKLGESLGGSKFDPSFWEKTFLGSDSLSHIGSQIKLFGRSMEKFYTSLSTLPGFKENEVDETTRKIDGVVYLAKEMAIAMQYMQQFGTTSEFLAELGANLVPFGESVGLFFNAIDRAILPEGNHFDKERSEILLNAVNSAATLLGTIKSLHDMLSFKSSTDMNAEVEKILGAFTGESGSQNAARMAALVRTFDEEFLKRLSGGSDLSEEYKEVGKRLATSLATGIQAAFDEDPNLTIKVKIEPVINPDQYPFNGVFHGTFDDTPGSGINAGELANSAMGANSQTESGMVTAKLTQEDLQAITAAIHSGPDGAATASDLTAAFSQMKIWLDKELLVGGIADAIDEAIGRKIFLINHTTTV